MPGLVVRIAQRSLAMATVCRHHWQLGHPSRHLTAYDHERQPTESII
jgi:hypothetical protein